MQVIPARPDDVPEEQRGHGTIHLRYEDVAQDGRVVLLALPQALGAAVWRAVVAKHPLARSNRKSGILPILSRLVMSGTDGTVSIAKPLTGSGMFELAHTRDDSGAIDRLIMAMWADVDGVVGRTYGPPPPGHGLPVRVGTVYAEHVFTRPFAPPEKRKVTEMTVDGKAIVPERELAWTPARELMSLPAGATPLDEMTVDPTPVVFGLHHTDSNQHVNSLVYPRLFEDAAVRRLAALGHSSVLGRDAEIAFRKPSFAADELRLALQAFELGDRVGAIGGYIEPSDAAAPAAARPRCALRMLFSR